MKQSDLTNKFTNALKKLRHDIENGSRKPLSLALSTLLLFSSSIETGSAEIRNIDNLQETTIKFEPVNPLQRYDVEMLSDSISQMSFKEVLANGLVNINEIRSYNFSTEDLKQLKPSILSKKLRNELYKNRYKEPEGRCLAGVREACNRAYKCDVYSPNKQARRWHEAVEKSDLPFVIIGSVNVRSENGCLVDHGNIKLQDLKVLDGAVVVISGGKGQPAGHVAGVYQYGNEVIGCSDGKENWANVVDRKIGGGNRRYGNEARVMICHDTQIPEGLAKHIAQNIKENEKDYSCSLAGNRLCISKNEINNNSEELFANNQKQHSHNSDSRLLAHITKQKTRNI